jgi:hypothetical protein
MTGGNGNESVALFLLFAELPNRLGTGLVGHFKRLEVISLGKQLS